MSQNNDAQEPQEIRVRLTLDVTYTPNGAESVELANNLYKMVEKAIDNGMLTGHSDAEVDQYSMETAVVPELLTEEEVENFMRQRVANGDLLLEDVPSRLARYGLLEVPAFIAEMRERIDMAKNGD
jgi:hypothetical protein